MPSLTSRRIDDPQSRKVVRALEAVGAGRSTVQLPSMTTSFRDDLRAQLVAVTPRLVAEGVHPGTETAPRRAASTSRRAAGADQAGPTARPSIRTRPMTVLVAGAAVVVLGLGGATWLARGALPGDPLYGLKRAAEGVDVSLSGSDLDKGHALLVSAQTRVEEVSKLVQKPQSMAFGPGTSAAGRLSDSTVKLVVSTLETADTDTQKGVTTIGDDAIERGDHAGLDLVVAWAQGQRTRIDALVTAIPVAGAGHDQAVASAANIRKGLQRAEQLQQDYTDKTCQRQRDDFGPSACLITTTPSTPSQPSIAPTSGATTSNPGGGATTAPTSGPATTPVAPGSTPPSTSPSSSATPAATTTTSGAPPVSIDSCGIQVTLPVAGVSLGTCPPNR